MKTIKVTWIDSATAGGWQDNPNADLGTMRIISVGFLVKEDKKHIQIAQSVGENQMSNTIAIPKFSIVSKRILEK